MCQAALAAAEQAEAAAQSSSEQASRALGAAQATARAMLVSKRAECEAAEMLEKTKNPKDADPVAAEMIRVCTCLSSLAISCHLPGCVWLRLTCDVDHAHGHIAPDANFSHAQKQHNLTSFIQSSLL